MALGQAPRRNDREGGCEASCITQIGPDIRNGGGFAAAGGTGPAARSVPRRRAMADFSRSYPAECRELVHHPQLRFQRRHRNIHFHFRLHGRLRLRPRHARTGHHRRQCASAAARLANLRRPHLSVHDLHGRDRLCRVDVRKSALRRRNEYSRFPQAAGCHDFSGAHSEVQAGQHGCAAAVHHVAIVLPADAVAFDPAAGFGAGRIGAPLCAGVESRLEFARLSERGMVLQSVCLAIAVCVRRLVRAQRLSAALRSRVVLAIAIAYLVFAFAVTLTWYVESLRRFVPVWLSDWMYPIDKTNLDVLRFAHFLALAAVTVYFIPRDWPWLKSRYLRPAILCGQHSLEIFCLGVFLAFAGQFIISEWSGGPLIQTFISLVGILIMVAVASLISWYKQIEGRSPTGRSKPPDADLAGGEA